MIDDPAMRARMLGSCRGMHPPFWHDGRGVWICARCHVSLDARDRPFADEETTAPWLDMPPPEAR